MQLVLLHGAVAAGKLTVARTLAVQIGYPVFHNHLVVDLLTTLFPYGSPPFLHLRESFWLATFSEAAKVDRSLIFTYSPDPAMPAGFADRVREAVVSSGGRVDFVQLVVSEGEQDRRIGNLDRAEFHKVNDLTTLRRVRERARRAEALPVDLRIDTDKVAPTEAVSLIIQTFGLQRESSSPRYLET